MKRQFRHIAVYLLCGLLFHAAHAENIYFSKIGIEQGLSQLSVMTIYQDEQGAMWFGTREGVNRYTGGEMETMQPQSNDSNSLSGNIVKKICGDGQGKVFIHTQSGVNQYELRHARLSIIESDPVDAICYGSRLWIADGKDLFVYQDGEKTAYAHIKEMDSEITVITELSNGRLIAGTVSDGVFIIDQNRKIRCILKPGSQISDIFEDSKKNIWIGTWEHGLFRIGRDGSQKQYLPDKKKPDNSISSAFVRTICEDNNDNLWIGTRKGLDCLYIENDRFLHYDANESNSRMLTNESVWSLYRDKQGTIWVGTYFGGVNYFNSESEFCIMHDLQKGIFSNRPFPVIADILEDEKHNLFLITEGEGLIYYRPQEKTYDVYKSDHNNPNSLVNDNIKTAWLDRQDKKLWLGTHLGGLCYLDLKTMRFRQFRHIKPEWDQSNIIRSIVPYTDNKLLIATYNGLFLFDRNTEKFSLFSEELHKQVSYHVDLKIDSGGCFWIASRGVFRYDPSTGQLDRFFHDPNDSTSLSSNNANKILIDSKGRIWIATNGGGLNLYAGENRFIHYNSHTCNLQNDYVSNCIESRYGYIVISTTHGLSMLDPENGQLRNFNASNGLRLNSLYNGGMSLTQNGELYIAGMNGMISFHEEDLYSTHRSCKLYLSDLWVNNQRVFPGDRHNILQQTLPYTEKIRLTYQQRMLLIKFATDNYISIHEPSFRYRMEGLSDIWINLPQQVHQLNFINLRPGKYRLSIEGISPTDGSIVATTGIDIQVTPPWYATWYAYLLYAAIIAFFLWRYIVFSRSRFALKTSLEYEKKEREQLEAVNQSKLRFFTNISHEFRTPLTLIIGQLDMLLQTQDIRPGAYNRLLNIKRNANTMLHLISELLEFRKSEQGYLQIKVAQLDFVAFIYEIYLSFAEFATYRNIKLDFVCNDEKIMLWFDPVQMQKVFYNLISNAFKYTPKGGIIRITVEQLAETVAVSVTDSGIGISADALNKIFDRFYQAENGLHMDKTGPGTGIGLALTKNIVEAHSATITVNSQVEAGSTFTVTLKKGSAHFTEAQKTHIQTVETNCAQQLKDLEPEFISEIINTQTTDGSPACTMLIVEDSKELQAMLKSIFEPIYRIITASDGEEGLQMTIEHQPDIVLSDLMMPKMSGSEMCQKIKNNINICHIPVVLLTAQTAIEYNIESLRLGADDYVTKPFNLKVLITRCNNLVNGRKLLQDKYMHQTEFPMHQIATNKLDLEFMEKAYKLIEDNLDNPDFDIACFSREMAMGRTRLFRKIKGICGQTPNDFIQTVRLKKAAFYLKNNPEYNIADITYMTGFGSPKYFAKCFKEQFGMPPTAYRKEGNNSEEENVDENDNKKDTEQAPKS